MLRLNHTFLHSITASSACLVMLPKWLITCFCYSVPELHKMFSLMWCNGDSSRNLLVLRLDWPHFYGSLPQVKGGTTLSCGRPSLTASTVCQLQPSSMRRSSVAMEVSALHTHSNFILLLSRLCTQSSQCCCYQHNSGWGHSGALTGPAREEKLGLF